VQVRGHADLREAGSDPAFRAGNFPAHFGVLRLVGTQVSESTDRETSARRCAIDRALHDVAVYAKPCFDNGQSIPRDYWLKTYALWRAQCESVRPRFPGLGGDCQIARQ
jgi:hypothetical protein